MSQEETAWNTWPTDDDNQWQTNESPLHRACEIGSIDEVREFLLKEWTNINERTADWLMETPLHYAVKLSSNSEIVRLLLLNGAEVDAQDASGNTPLHEACRLGCSEIVRVLLNEGGADVHVHNSSDDQTPLHLACEIRSLEIVSLLLRSGASVHSQSSKSVKGYTPLNSACRAGSLEIVSLLLEHGADPLQEDSSLHGTTPLLEACVSPSPNTSLVTRLIDLGANVNCLATPHHLFQFMRLESISMTTSNSLKSPAVLSPLHAACHVNNEEVVSLLLRAGAKIDLRSVPGCNCALHFSCASSHHLSQLRVTELLFQSGADVNNQNNDGNTPAHLACLFHSPPETILYLLNLGADPTLKNDNGETIFHLCCGSCDYDGVVSSILERGINPNIRDKLMNTPLHSAVKTENTNAVCVLLEQCGAALKINAKNKSGYTPLFLACLLRNKDIVSFLLEHGANVNVKNRDNISAFSWVLRKRMWDIAKVILDEGTNLKVDHLAISANSVPVSLMKEMMYHRFKKPWLCFTSAVQDPCSSIAPSPVVRSSTSAILRIPDLCRYLCEFL